MNQHFIAHLLSHTIGSLYSEKYYWVTIELSMLYLYKMLCSAT